MARKARERAKNGMYYVELKSNNRLLFVEEEDFKKMTDILLTAQQKDFTEIYSFYFGDECIELVLKEGLKGVSDYVRSIGSMYAQWFNRKYKAEGKLFHDRFRSEPLERNSEIVDGVRKVHYDAYRNGVLDTPRSSHKLIVRREIFESETVVMLFGSVFDFNEEIKKDNPESKLKQVTRLSDEELLVRIKEVLDGLRSAGVSDEVIAIKTIMQIEGATLSSVARALNLSRATLRNVIED